MKARLPANSLVSALAAGEQGAYAVLYDRLGPALLRVGRLMLRNTEEAEDAVQDVFVGLVKSRQHLSRVEDLDTYVFGCLRHAVVRRRIRRERERSHLERIARSLIPDEKHGGTSDCDLEGALKNLPAEQRDVIALKIDGALTFAQIAQVLGISQNTVASRYRYALEKLRKLLEKQE